MNIERCLTVEPRTLRLYSMLRSPQEVFDSFSLSRPNRSNPSSTSRSIPAIACGSASILYYEYRIPNDTPDLILSVECSVLSRHAIVLPTSTVRFAHHLAILTTSFDRFARHLAITVSPISLPYLIKIRRSLWNLPQLVSAFVDELFLLPAARLQATSDF